MLNRLSKNSTCKLTRSKWTEINKYRGTQLLKLGQQGKQMWQDLHIVESLYLRMKNELNREI